MGGGKGKGWEEMRRKMQKGGMGKKGETKGGKEKGEERKGKETKGILWGKKILKT